MTSLHALITALVRLLGLFFAVRALDRAAGDLFYVAQMSGFPSGQGVHNLDDATLVYVFLTVVLLCGGLLLIAKFHRISQWMARRRTAANRDVEETAPVPRIVE